MLLIFFQVLDQRDAKCPCQGLFLIWSVQNTAELSRKSLSFSLLNFTPLLQFLGSCPANDYLIWFNWLSVTYKSNEPTQWSLASSSLRHQLTLLLYTEIPWTLVSHCTPHPVHPTPPSQHWVNRWALGQILEMILHYYYINSIVIVVWLFYNRRLENAVGSPHRLLAFKNSSLLLPVLGWFNGKMLETNVYNIHNHLGMYMYRFPWRDSFSIHATHKVLHSLNCRFHFNTMILYIILWV